MHKWEKVWLYEKRIWWEIVFMYNVYEWDYYPKYFEYIIWPFII